MEKTPAPAAVTEAFRMKFLRFNFIIVELQGNN
jgi:hypothetical protein